MNKTILLGHGSGGKLSRDLISTLFVKYFDNPILKQQTDSALLNIETDNISFTTDSYVVDPIFFPGGNIGDLAICGTVNDLSVSGAKPMFLSVSFIIEEGLLLNHLEIIVKTMAKRAKEAGVLIVTGDTKVVNRGKCDKIFINTSGIGILYEDRKHISNAEKIENGDKIIINGSIADHGMAIIGAREGINFQTEIKTDSAPLNSLISKVLDEPKNIHFMRDITRGGLSTVLTEIVEKKNFGIEIYENNIPVNENVRGICELLGFDPLFVANEGKVLFVVKANRADVILNLIRENEYGKDAQIIGEVTSSHSGKAILKTQIGGSRIIDMLAGEQLPRIC